ncbi:MAG: hypothetical protein AB7U92_01015 [Piscinibacter sp.]|uniref:hypothetical protein n=1 Tax=Piscinibacter sp. TaxID=1903157 RepID=UPI003D14961E
MSPWIYRCWMLLHVILLGGCASWRASFNEFSSKEASEQYVSVDRHSSYPVIRRDTFEQVNLLEMIDPRHESASSGMKAWDREDAKQNYGRQYDLVLAWFRSSAQSPEQKRLHRDGVQDKILAVSTSRCNVFKTFLRRQQTDVNFALGSLTTVAGVLGAILPGATASRNLAGTAGIFSGLQAEYNQAYFSNLAAHVIVQAIELRQNRLKRELVDGRQGKGIDEYSMEAAINDAIVIDGNCSALAGLIEAQDSIKEVETPGMRLAARAMTSARALQELNSKPITELQKDGSLDKLLSVAGATVPSLLVTSAQPGPVAGGLGVALVGAANVANAVLQHADLQAGLVGKTFADLQQKAAEDKRSILAAATVSAEFNKIVSDKLKLGPPGEPFTTCAAQLKQVAGELGQRTSELSVVRGDSAATANAANAVDVAQAKVRLLLTQAGAVKDAAQAQIDAAAAAARAGLPAADKMKEFGPSELKVLLDGLPLDPAKIAARCG